MLAINFLDWSNMHIFEGFIFNYQKALDSVDELSLSGLESKSLFPKYIPFVGRPPGTTGTPYATTALISATAIYFYILKKWSVFLAAFALLVLWATGSSLAVLIAILAILNRKRWYFPLMVFMGIIVLIVLIEARGFPTNVYFDFGGTFSANELLAAVVIGEGKHVSSIQTEFRIVGLFFSLGLLGVAAFGGILINYWLFVKSMQNEPGYKRVFASWWFIITLLLCNWHYQTLFLYPNIVLVVILISFVASRDSVNEIRTKARGDYKITVDCS